MASENSNHENHDSEHTHGAIDRNLLRSERGIWAVKWSLLGLMITAAIQVVIVAFSGSIALLADTIHNFGDGLTAVPLWIAFRLSKKEPNRRFTYGYGRFEDIAGLFVILMILISALIAGYETWKRFLNPREVSYLGAVAVAAVIGFLGNEAVALFRIKVGEEIGSAALIADGHHARVDGLTSLAVLGGVIGVWLGYPIADPIAGLIITIAIVKILWDSSIPIFNRLLDGVDPQVVDEIEYAIQEIDEVKEIAEIHVRWMGHKMRAEINIAVDSNKSVKEGHRIAKVVHNQLLDRLKYLSSAIIHVDPLDESGREYH